MTAIQMHVDGHWLSVEPQGIAARAGARRRAAARMGQAVATSAVVGALAIAVLQVTGTRAPGAAPTAMSETAPPSAPPTAAVPSMPVPPAELSASFVRWGADYGVPVPLLEALTWHESRWQANAVSEAGAIGVGQLMPATAAGLEASIGVDLDPWHADDNVRMAAHLLGTLLASSGHDVRIALAGYAQGAASVAHDGMTASTRQYVAEMLVLYSQFRAARGVTTTP